MWDSQIDFDSIQASIDLERRQKEETDRKLEECKKEKLDQVNTEYAGVYACPDLLHFFIFQDLYIKVNDMMSTRQENILTNISDTD